MHANAFSVDPLCFVFAESLTAEQVAAGMPRPLLVGTFTNHLVACMEGNFPFEWDRRRLGIDETLENQVQNSSRI